MMRLAAKWMDKTGYRMDAYYAMGEHSEEK